MEAFFLREKILWNEDWLFCAEPLPARAFSVKGPLYKQAKTERARSGPAARIANWKSERLDAAQKIGGQGMKRLLVRERYFYWEDGEPFFYLGDTAWELLHQLNREEIARYMALRAQQGFTVVQTVALAELDGLRVPNAYGRKPLLDGENGQPDPTRPDVAGDYSYWDHVDYAVETAAEHGLVIALLPTWGDKFCSLWGKGPCVFTPENAYQYGKWLGARYASRWNILWMLGGDRALNETTRPIIDRMAEGIREADGAHLMTFHPPGSHNSTEYLNDAAYIDFHTAQTGHDVAKCYPSDAEMRAMSLASAKPYMDSEPRYEDHPACFNEKLGYYWQAADVRQNAYWDVFAGACGHTFGNHNIWCCNANPNAYYPHRWQEALDHPAAGQMRWVKRLRLRGDYASFRPAPEVLVEQYAGEGHLAAARGEGYCYVYTPLGMPFTVRLAAIAAPGNVLKAYWMDPRTGEEKMFGVYPVVGENLFVPPSRGKGEDWVLILEAAR